MKQNFEAREHKTYVCTVHISLVVVARRLILFCIEHETIVTVVGFIYFFKINYSSRVMT